jgi:hypothetical protein
VIYRKTEFLERITLPEPMIDKLLELDKARAGFRAEIEPLVGKEAADGVMTRLDQLVKEAIRQRTERERNRASATAVAPPQIVGGSASTVQGPD